jgi:L-2-hydroxyglutarate oxidase LhgO
VDEVAITIIGAGVIGLAVAAELSHDYDNIILLERHDKFGQETSSRNSEVIHAGIYYPPSSLKATLCVKGAELLYRYCEDHGIPHRRIGKLIGATEDSELSDLEEILQRGLQNGVHGLSLLDKQEIIRKEPHTNLLAALYSPNTGIIDSHSLMAHLHGTANGAGVICSFNSEVSAIEKGNNGYRVRLKSEDYIFHSRVVVNCAGLAADSVAQLAGIDIDEAGYRLQYSKGSYFSYGKTSPVKMLVYPVPHKDLAGLGVHATLDLGRRLRFGPDAEYVERIDYRVDPGKRDAFYESAARIIRGLDREAFVPDMAGIRPKIKGEGIKDFVIRHEADRGLDGLINLIGIESPGLTASLAIAELVRDLVRNALR